MLRLYLAIRVLAMEYYPVEIQPDTGPLTDDEIAAAIIAVQTFLSDEAPAPQSEAQPESGWHRSAKLSIQNLRPARLSTAPRWNTIERLRRSMGGFYGITGL
jgi:hypothetical protein